MEPPAVAAAPFISVTIQLTREPVGRTPFGWRLEVPFAGTATSELWDGEWTVTGVDHLTVASNGTSAIDVHVRIAGDGETDVVTYRGHGRSAAGRILEGVTFETPSDRLASLNDTVAVGVAGLDGDRLSIELYRLS